MPAARFADCGPPRGFLRSLLGFGRRSVAVALALAARAARAARRHVDGFARARVFAVIFDAIRIELVPVEIDASLHAGETRDVRIAGERPSTVRVVGGCGQIVGPSRSG